MNRLSEVGGAGPDDHAHQPESPMSTRASGTSGNLIELRPQGAVLSVRNLTVRFPSTPKGKYVVDGVSLDLRPGEVLGLLGESGSGKTLTGSALMGLIPYLDGQANAEEYVLAGEHIDLANPQSMRARRGSAISMIFQQPRRALNPAYTIGDQLAETIRKHKRVGRKVAWQLAVKALDDVRIVRPDKRAKDYPHMLSGGMCQRVMIAIALSCEPSVLVADEPTSALDVTVQKGILGLLRELCLERDLGVIFVTHDLAVASEMCDRIAIMYAGQVVESGQVADVLGGPRHPYTSSLLGALPRLGLQRFESIPGSPPGIRRPAGCRFHPRCRFSVAGRCDVEVPALESVIVPTMGEGSVGTEHLSRCLRVDEIELRGVHGADASA